VKYLERFDLMSRFIQEKFDMPDSMITLLVKFLEQGQGKISQRGRKKEFKQLTSREVGMIEKKYKDVFG